MLYIMRGALLPPDGLWRSPRWVGPPVPEIPGIRKPACVSEGRALLQQPALSLALVGLGPGSVAFHRVWWAPRQPRRALPPDVPWCLGWKRNRAVGLKGAESSHPALFPGHPPSLFLNGILSGWWQEGVQHRGPFAGGLEGGGWPWGGLGREKDRNRADLRDERGRRQRPLRGSCE